jgi:ERCC4-related helicase
VHIPHLVRIVYPKESVDDAHSRTLVTLQQALESYDLAHDPYVLELLKQRDQGYDVSRQIQKVYVGGKTYCREQLRSLVAKVEATLEELGPSIMEWYLSQCLTKFEKMVHASDYQLLEWSVDEKKHLLDMLKGLTFSNNNVWASTPLSLDHTSKKTHLLVDLLASGANGDPNFTCLVFIEQRIWVACVAEILAHHPRTTGLLRVGTWVGTSQDTKRKATISTFAEPRNQQATLDDFRAGKLNVILATSVLEEGIDVSSCHLVIDFEAPKNLKSFVQRRGRARKQESKYIIFLPESGGGRAPQSWQSLEEEMKAVYMDDLRQAKLAEERELQADEGQRYFEVPSTG